MALTLRPNDAQEAHLNDLKDFYKEKVNSKAIFKAIKDVPKMNREINDLERTVRSLESRLAEYEYATHDYLSSLEKLRTISDSRS